MSVTLNDDRAKQRNITSVWAKVLKKIVRQGLKPTVMVSLKVESYLEQTLKIYVSYPGLSKQQALAVLHEATRNILNEVKHDAQTAIITP